MNLVNTILLVSLLLAILSEVRGDGCTNTPTYELEVINMCEQRSWTLGRVYISITTYRMGSNTGCVCVLRSKTPGQDAATQFSLRGVDSNVSRCNLSQIHINPFYKIIGSEIQNFTCTSLFESASYTGRTTGDVTITLSRPDTSVGVSYCLLVHPDTHKDKNLELSCQSGLTPSSPPPTSTPDSTVSTSTTPPTTTTPSTNPPTTTTPSTTATTPSTNPPTTTTPSTTATDLSTTPPTPTTPSTTATNPSTNPPTTTTPSTTATNPSTNPPTTTTLSTTATNPSTNPPTTTTPSTTATTPSTNPPTTTTPFTTPSTTTTPSSTPSLTTTPSTTPSTSSNPSTPAPTSPPSPTSSVTPISSSPTSSAASADSTAASGGESPSTDGSSPPGGDRQDSEKTSFPVAAVAGGVSGAVVFIIIVIIIIVVVCKRRRSGRKSLIQGPPEIEDRGFSYPDLEEDLHNPHYSIAGVVTMKTDKPDSKTLSAMDTQPLDGLLAGSSSPYQLDEEAPQDTGAVSINPAAGSAMMKLNAEKTQPPNPAGDEYAVVNNPKQQAPRKPPPEKPPKPGAPSTSSNDADVTTPAGGDVYAVVDKSRSKGGNEESGLPSAEATPPPVPPPPPADSSPGLVYANLEEVKGEGRRSSPPPLPRKKVKETDYAEIDHVATA